MSNQETRGHFAPGPERDPAEEEAERQRRAHATFSDNDVIRIFCNHLTGEEQGVVLVFFWLVLPAFIGASVILEWLGFLPTRIRVPIFGALLVFFRQLDINIESILANIVPARNRGTILKCLEDAFTN